MGRTTDNSRMTVGITGHRPDKLGGEYGMNGPISTKVYHALERIINELQPTTMATGMALGADMIFANLAINLKIDWMAVIPFKGQELKWPEKSQRLYHKLLSMATGKITVGFGGYSAKTMQDRNEWLVDHVDVLIAVWDGSTGGTGNCVKYARSVGKKIIYVNPKAL